MNYFAKNRVCAWQIWGLSRSERTTACLYFLYKSLIEHFHAGNGINYLFWISKHHLSLNQLCRSDTKRKRERERLGANHNGSSPHAVEVCSHYNTGGEIIWFSYSNHCLSINLEIFMKTQISSIPPAPSWELKHKVEWVRQWLARTWFRQSLFGSDSCLHSTGVKILSGTALFQTLLQMCFLEGTLNSAISPSWLLYRTDVVPLRCARGRSDCFLCLPPWIRCYSAQMKTVTFGCWEPGSRLHQQFDRLSFSSV